MPSGEFVAAEFVACTHYGSGAWPYSQQHRAGGSAHGPDGFQRGQGVIAADTIIPNWNGDKLDLDHAIWATFANARLTEERHQDQAPAA